MMCFYCKGSIESKLTNFIADLGSTNIIVKDVPSEVCTQCGEVSFSDKVARRLEQIVEEMKKQNLEIAVTRYAEKAA
ncbi:MAG: type II toxin-antitoxin system MqsA family antitoxin [Lachnospiraceae bacterium]|nr:type II toxin-antitoxin system MqsA family antitoxin [Lachnospiraceae bacterium]